jgi:hypothetical protein
MGARQIECKRSQPERSLLSCAPQSIRVCRFDDAVHFSVSMLVAALSAVQNEGAFRSWLAKGFNRRSSS